MSPPLRVAMVGCGNIADQYVATMKSHADEVILVVAFDLERRRAERMAASFGGRVASELDAMLSDDGIDIVLNLTPPTIHADVTAAALRAGRHVYSEKPLATRASDGRRLVQLAKEHELRLACAPSTFLGEAQQTALAVLEEGRLGTVRLVYAEANQGRIETWHPEPASFYALGPLSDVGVYPITLVTAALGPVRSVHAAGRALRDTVVALDGTRVPVTAPEILVAALELASGALVRLTTTFYVGKHSRQRGIEFHGDDGSLGLSSWQRFDAQVELGREREDWTPIAPARTRFDGTEWCRGLLDLADAIHHRRPHRCSGEHAAHVVDVIEAVEAARRGGAVVSVDSDFSPPELMPWAYDDLLLDA